MTLLDMCVAFLKTYENASREAQAKAMVDLINKVKAPPAQAVAVTNTSPWYTIWKGQRCYKPEHQRRRAEGRPETECHEPQCEHFNEGLCYDDEGDFGEDTHDITHTDNEEEPPDAPETLSEKDFIDDGPIKKHAREA